MDTLTEAKKLENIRTAYQKWATSRGFTAKTMFDIIKKKDKNELVDEFDPTFYSTLKQKIQDKDFAWIRDNVDQEEYKNTQDYCDFIRRKTYMLANPFEKENKTLSAPSLKIPKQPKEIVCQKNNDKIIQEVDALREKNGRLLKSKNYEVFFAQSKRIPNLKFEIGRLREITFREVGEGTNEAIDLDKFDTYYHHMFLWDSDTNVLAGAYRMGLGNEIYKKY